MNIEQKNSQSFTLISLREARQSQALVAEGVCAEGLNSHPKDRDIDN